jgi:hypothetical protein
MDGFQIAPQRPWYRPPPYIVILGVLGLLIIGGIAWAVFG